MAKIAYEVEGEDYHPVTTPNGELHNIGETTMKADDISMNYLDVWGANIYRGLSFGDLFSQYAAKSSKPFWVSEYGIDAWDHQKKKENQEIQAIYADTLWNEMKANSNICAGGTIMAYSDEWWKNGTPTAHDIGGYQNFSFPDNWSDEEYYGIMWVEDDGDNPDIMHPRVVYYTLQSKWGISNPPEVGSITPNSAEQNTRNLKVAIIGNYFQAKPTVKLINDESTVSGKGTVVQTPEKIITTFDLKQADIGTYSVIVTNPDGQSGILSNSFEIKRIPDPPPADVSEFKASGDKPEVGKVLLEWRNPSDPDFAGVLIRYKTVSKNDSPDYPKSHEDGSICSRISRSEQCSPGGKSLYIHTPPKADGNTKYCYTIFAYDDAGNYAPGTSTEACAWAIPTCVIVYPNPVVLSKGHKEVTFWGSGVPYATINIYNITGELVKTIEEQKGQGRITWDLTNNNGKKVASGIYIYQTVNPIEKNSGKIGIIK
jgi:hypothetical protein